MFGRPSLRELLRSQHDEFISHHDEFMGRHEEFMGRHEEAMRRQECQHEEVMQRLKDQHDEFMRYQDKRDAEFLARTEEFREFNREILLRNEKVYTALVDEMGEWRKQVQASTKAVLSVLDRLEGLGGTAAA